MRIPLPPLAVFLGTGGAIVSLAALVAPAIAQVPSDSMAVAVVVDRYHHALAAGDSAAALALLSPNAIILESGGDPAKWSGWDSTASPISTRRVLSAD